MSQSKAVYDQTEVNTVQRYAKFAAYDEDTVHGIVDACPIVHVAFLPDPYDQAPVILPMVGKIGRWPPGRSDGPASCYIHGAQVARLMKVARKASSSSAGAGADTGADADGAGDGADEGNEEQAQVEDEDDDDGLPMCISATLLDGLSLSLTPYSHNLNFRSAVLHGVAHPVRAAPEKLYAMQLITDAVLPGQWTHTRTPPTRAELTSTCILKMVIRAASAKVRAAEPVDGAADLARREDVVERVWTGTVPVWQRWGTPVPSSYNAVKDVPPHVRDFVERGNEQGEKYAVEAASKPCP